MKHTFFYMRSFLCVLLSGMMLLLSGCDYVPTYGGEHSDLSLVALKSIPGTKSNSGDGFLVLEQDDYGRTLFVASVYNSILSLDSLAFPSVYALAVMQKSDDAYVYFYGGQSYAYKISEDFERLTTETYQQHFSEEEINWIKESNDWGKPWDQIDREIIKIPTDVTKETQVPQSSLDALERHFGNRVFAVDFRKDIDGNTSVFVLLVESYKYEWYMAIFDDKWNLIEDSITKLDGPDSLQQDVENFLNQQNWIEITE